MKFVLEVLSLTFLATVGATTGDDTQGPEEQQQIYQQYGQTTPNNGIDTNMLLMMAVINHNQMNKMINMMSMITKNGSCNQTTVPNPPTNQLRNETECGSAKPRIVGGEDTVENGIPWQCNFYDSAGFDDVWNGCGGTIINCNPTIIVTSAYCVDYMVPAKVTCGDWKIDATDANEHTLNVTEVILHPQFDGIRNDIAVVKVDGTMKCSKGTIWPACLPNNQVEYTYEGWTDTFVSGWGAIKSTSKYSNTLKFVTVPLVSDDICKNNAEFSYYEDLFVPEEMICAGMEGKGVCQGDSGSPLVTRATGDPGYSLIGIVSWEWGCAESAEPYAVYTKFARYLKWVADQFGMEMTT